MRTRRLMILALTLSGCSGADSASTRLEVGTPAVAVNSEADLAGSRREIPILIEPAPLAKEGAWPSLPAGTHLRVLADSGKISDEALRKVVVKIEDGDLAGKTGTMFRASLKPLQ